MQTEAEWAVALETEQKGDRFSLLESPGLSSDPAKPNRPALIFLGLLLGLGGGLGYVASAENLDKTVRNKRDLVELMDMPPIAAIPLMANKADARRTMLRMSVAAASLVIGILYTTSVVIENYGTN